MPYGFPSGREMLFEIAEDCQSTPTDIDRYLQKLGYKKDRIVEFGCYLQTSGQSSVDSFLTTERGSEYTGIGKTAIAASLLGRESRRDILPRDSDFSEGRWYERLFSAYGANTQDHRLSQENLAIITFNYDRSLERYLFNAFLGSHKMEEENIYRKICIACYS